jgi:hypothetical protein
MDIISEKDYKKLYCMDRICFTGIIKWNTGTVTFMKNGFLHREDGPAYIGFKGYKEWLFEGKYHNLNGPAIIYPDGHEEYWVRGTWLKNCISNEALQLYLDMLKLKKIPLEFINS